MKVLTIAGFVEWLGKFFKLVSGDETLLVGDFFDAANLVAGALFDNLDELAGAVHGLEGAGIQPSAATSHGLDLELASF